MYVGAPDEVEGCVVPRTRIVNHMSFLFAEVIVIVGLGSHYSVTDFPPLVYLRLSSINLLFKSGMERLVAHVGVFKQD